MELRTPLLALLLVAWLAPPVAMADALDAQRRAFPAAFEAARSGPPGRWQELARDLEDYPLAPWLPYSALVRDLQHAPPRDIEAFLARHDGSLPADLLRTRWLRHLASRRDWQRFVADWRPQADLALQCRHGEARIATGATTGLAEELRRRRPDLPALFTTGYTRNAIVHQGRLDPDVHLLNKPYTHQDLGRKVRILLDAAKTEAEETV